MTTDTFVLRGHGVAALRGGQVPPPGIGFTNLAGVCPQLSGKSGREGEAPVCSPRENAMAREFHIIIERDAEGYYVATVPQLQGCHTQAKSLDTLMKRV